MPTKLQPVFRLTIPVDQRRKDVDVIEHNHASWLVLRWELARADGLARPTRVASTNMVELRQVIEETGQSGFLSITSIPASLFFVEAVPPDIHAKYEVVDNPGLEAVYLPGLTSLTRQSEADAEHAAASR